MMLALCTIVQRGGCAQKSRQSEILRPTAAASSMGASYYGRTRMLGTVIRTSDLEEAPNVVLSDELLARRMSDMDPPCKR